ncbi:ATP-binding protein [Halosquirtibacter laminarini]|uniref:ATP-binding protein n=1 Tax=Halosquirtibacter laminarini TaxID=3374600 RepID=A0AC61NGJ1_9BACT|nr:ATP-binding protein [Prolixibacteraceae bacterium]
MKEIALHIIDLIENSIRAKANQITFIYDEDNTRKSFCIIDDGIGMSKEELNNALDPLYTTKPKKQIGLGLSLTKQSVLQSAGTFHIHSTPNKGTEIVFSYVKKNIDCPPTGDIIKVLTQAIIAHPTIQFSFCYRQKNNALIDTSFLTNEERVNIKYSDLHSFIKEAFVEIDINGF